MIQRILAGLMLSGGWAASQAVLAGAAEAAPATESVSLRVLLVTGGCCHNYKLQGESLTRLLQGTAGGAVATIVIGFYWGGWTLGSTAEKQVKNAEQASIVRVLAPICADKFQRSADASTNMQALKKADSWKRDEFIQKAGWGNVPRLRA